MKYPLEFLFIDSSSSYESNKDKLLEEIMNEYGQSIMWLAFTYVKDQKLAEDITQEVFIKCYKNIDKFRYDSSIKTWLYSITTNYCKDVLKSFSYKTLKLNQLFFEQLPNKETPENKLEQKMRAEELSNSVLKLPVKYREILILFYFEELKIEQISELLNMKENTIKSRLYRGRQLLKEIYEGNGSYGK